MPLVCHKAAMTKPGILHCVHMWTGKNATKPRTLRLLRHSVTVLWRTSFKIRINIKQCWIEQPIKSHTVIWITKLVWRAKGYEKLTTTGLGDSFKHPLNHREDSTVRKTIATCHFAKPMLQSCVPVSLKLILIWSDKEQVSPMPWFGIFNL